MKNENYAKSNDIKNLQNDIKILKNKIDFDKISKLRLDELTQLSYEDYQNIKKLKNNNGIIRSNSVPGLLNQNENYILNINKDEEKDKLKDDLINVHNSINDLDERLKNTQNDINNLNNKFNQQPVLDKNIIMKINNIPDLNFDNFNNDNNEIKLKGGNIKNYLNNEEDENKNKIDEEIINKLSKDNQTLFKDIEELKKNVENIEKENLENK